MHPRSVSVRSSPSCTRDTRLSGVRKETNRDTCEKMHTVSPSRCYCIPVCLISVDSIRFESGRQWCRPTDALHHHARRRLGRHTSLQAIGTECACVSASLASLCMGVSPLCVATGVLFRSALLCVHVGRVISSDCTLSVGVHPPSSQLISVS